ncbi:uncharacterized protein L3040_003962 [Drepanopeziza brunnea f. sp. 'multigermtubi']|uniref:uncharacterized protein n=1 Tax=Drepanopeziza brunnea f. sp. 'multigermtubi' TaxID=698441 RepID=UPI00239B2C7F|nr:hypothetical protein L3040_003962 [Drepanopeziza brunnea f. sp. 'multigermtubi']
MLSKYFSATLLALCFLFDSAQGIVQEEDGFLERIVIGYRTVNTAEAELINKFNIPYRGQWVDDAREKKNQLGNGLHLSNTRTCLLAG